MRKKKSDKVFLLLFLFSFFLPFSLQMIIFPVGRGTDSRYHGQAARPLKKGVEQTRDENFFSLSLFKSPAHFSLFQKKIFSSNLFHFFKEKKMHHLTLSIRSTERYFSERNSFFCIKQMAPIHFFDDGQFNFHQEREKLFVIDSEKKEASHTRFS